MAPKRGRPRGLNLNPSAVESLLLAKGISKQELCEAAGIGAGHLADSLYRGKGLNAAAVNAIATRLEVSPGTIAPQLVPGFIFLRPGDVEPEAVAS